MPRTLTRDRSIFFIPGQGGITFHPNTAAVTITFPVGSTGRTGLHWHETHTEFLSVLQGVALITLGTVTETFGPTDGTITIPRFTHHEYRRADSAEAGTDGRDVNLTVKEWTEPADGQKQVFFRNVLGIIEDRAGETLLWNLWTLWQLFVVFAGNDNYPLVLPAPATLGPLKPAVERYFTYVVLQISLVLGGFVGLRSRYPEYTPTKQSSSVSDDAYIA
ncbi:hypothetical protein B0A49_04483 [Cryomyces minteri]|uniref:Cupin 2 conserved barrel domain-containing protein n=1 Tax=Cryomyces minteri TaxID=331657 RepID=A0A4U0WWA6_9PEZI|nr:hypothetical protein B0A49_04483 [Cryomyces minteri]